LQVYCQRTCGYCATTTTTTGLTRIGVSWNGFCTNTFYTLAQRKAYCAKSCNLC
uniref:ShKT domain-containing protein n=1 Tax=Heligmosomoides polygyrus TaxID=6339 RepID=A0A183FAW0_HELPZ